MYFSRNSPKGHTKKERGVEKRRKGTYFSPCATLKPAILIFPLSLCPSCSLESLLYLFPTLFPHTSDPFLSLVLIYLLQPLVFRYFLATSFISPRNSFLQIPPSSVCSLGIPLVYVSASLIISFTSLEYLLFFIRFCFSFDYCPKVCVECL